MTGSLAIEALVRSDIERSHARVADIELGLTARDMGDRVYWRDRAQLRVDALEVDSRSFGLLPHEETELERLKELLAGSDDRNSKGGGQ
jgi:uncharacterized protein YcfL